ncbi:MAG: MoaD/ThiS family protein [Acidimicrobiales bacterium]
MTVSVHLASTLRDLTGGVADVEVEAATVRGVIRALDERFPGMAERLAAGTSVAIDGDIMPDADFEPVPDGAEIHFLPSISGG